MEHSKVDFEIEMNVGDIILVPNKNFAFRVLCIGCTECARCVWVFDGEMKRYVFDQVHKLRDIRKDNVSCCLPEWFRFDTATKIKRIEAAILSRDLGWRGSFKSFVEGNLEFVDAVVQQIIYLRTASKEHWSMRTIFEFIRHETAIQHNEDIVKINNNWAPDMARLATVLFPEIGDMFELRVPQSGRRVVA